MKKRFWIIGLIVGLATACEQPGEEASDDGNATGGEDGDGVGDGDGGEGGGSKEAQLCQRAADCLYLEAGYTVGDCTDIVEACTDDLLTSAHMDWNVWAGDCLSLNNCMNFGACYRSIDVCTLYVEVDADVGSSGDWDPPSDDGGSAPPDPSGGDSGPPDDSGSGCGADAQACLDEWTLGVCDGGDLYVYDCLEACLAGGYEDTYGCGYDPDAGADMCFCA
jgi:hypothetical protein